mgnify:CR=1 FL=1
MGAHRKTIKYTVNERGCFICTSHHLGTHGYPQIWKDGRPQNMHRVLYEEKYGLLPPKIEVRHTCDTPACINMEHMLPGTTFDNAQDRTIRGRNNPPIGERSGTAKLTEEQVSEIRAASGSQGSIGKRYGIGQSQVSRIKGGQRWGHSLTS